jgi:dihydrofolate synthase/folylpolyglutamate synthase
MEDLVDTCDNVFKIVEERNLDLRFFEIVTLLGFIEFRRHAVDYVVLECGLGGRIDATNIVQ